MQLARVVGTVVSTRKEDSLQGIKLLVGRPLAADGKATGHGVVSAVRKTMLENAELLAKAAHDETGYGRYEDKVVKNRLVTEKTPGIEELYPNVVTGDHGLTLTEPAPFGTIAAITPTTNPTSTII